MKTAIQITIDKMKEAKENLPPFSFHDEFLRGFNKAFQMAIFIAEKNGLEAEKKQIIESYLDGLAEGIIYEFWEDVPNGLPEEYYEQTFKSDE